jgi:hypothetical protein
MMTVQPASAYGLAQLAQRQQWQAEAAPFDWEAPILRATGRAAADLSALPAIVNITIMAGMDYRVLLTVHGVDLTGIDLAAQIRVAPGAEVAGSFAAQVSSEDSSVIVLDLTHDVTEALPPLARYDVWLCTPPRTPLLAGMITTEPSITSCGPTA